MITIYFKDNEGTKVLMSATDDSNLSSLPNVEGIQQEFLDRVPKDNCDPNVYIILDGQEYKLAQSEKGNERRHKFTVAGEEPIMVDDKMKAALMKIWKGNSFSVESGPYAEPWS